MSDLRQPLLLSLAIACAATVLCAAVAIPLAYAMARRTFLGKSIAEALITVPLVLPPTVVGYLLIILLGRRGVVGTWLSKWFDYSVLFRPEGAVLAAAVVALPLLYLPAKAAFASIDRELEDVARLMGAGRLQVFLLVAIPLARRGLLSGLLLAFARALGEFGATVMVFGLSSGRETLPMKVFFDYERGELSEAVPAVVALGMLSFLLIVLYNRSSAGQRD